MPLCLSCDTSESNSVMEAGLNGGGTQSERMDGWNPGLVAIIGDDKPTRDIKRQEPKSQNQRTIRSFKKKSKSDNSERANAMRGVLSHPAWRADVAESRRFCWTFYHFVRFNSFSSSSTMPPKASEGSEQPSTASSFFTVPPPIKKLFDKFPLATYPANDLPQRSPSRRQGNQLFVFSDAAAARKGQPSYNPQCLKWQVSRLCREDCRGKCSDGSSCFATGVSEIRRNRLRNHPF